MFDPEKHHRRSVRLRHHDYRAAGAYFITICSHEKRPVFGRIECGKVRLHPYGRILQEEWIRTGELRVEIELDEWIVMPNHFHAILIINQAAQDDLEESQFGRARANSLSTIVGQLKSIVTKRINDARGDKGLAPVIV